MKFAFSLTRYKTDHHPHRLLLVVAALFLTGILLVATAPFSGGPLFNPALAASEAAKSLPSLNEFRRDLNPVPQQALTGVYVPQVMAYPILRQPDGNPAHISSRAGVVTLFSLAETHKTTGLLAHNYLAGESFSKLALGQRVILVFGDGSIQQFKVTEIARFKALSPLDPFSSFENLEGRPGILSVTEVFNRFFTQGNQVVFMTCIEAEGNLAWGRLFVVAKPIKHLFSVGKILNLFD